MENDAWVPGTVAKLHVEHEGGSAPFAVNLDRGDAVIAPADDDRFIRAFGGLRFGVGDIAGAKRPPCQGPSSAPVPPQARVTLTQALTL